jgi:hypothetical protein
MNLCADTLIDKVEGKAGTTFDRVSTSSTNAAKIKVKRYAAQA